ncbi:MAG: PKD domain-containing protein, partial [Candidatus Thermoplasmatota archaeon]|nr:PKD domain-containing protein [Candidatus Thermoplasmatota archaeon]
MDKIAVTFVSLLLLTAVLSGCIQEETGTANKAPSVAVTSPYDGQTLSGVVSIRGTASDPDGTVEKVTVSILNHRLIGIRILNVSGTTDWQCRWDTTQDVDGRYTISVRCSDNNGSYSQQEYVDVLLANNVSNHAPVADFTFNADGLTVSFTDHSYDVDNDSLEYRWMFGHQYTGPDATLQNPVHTFPSAGTYTVTLTVDDGYETDTVMTNITVSTVENSPPSCSLTVDTSTGVAPLEVTFSMSASDSDGYISLWRLDVDGDGLADYSGSGAPDYQQHHVYEQSGTYTATLTVEDDTGADASASVTITVSSGDGKSNFSIACWNLQRFGPTKASNDTLLDYYADKFDDYDLFIVQEITDASGTAIVALADKLPQYSYIISTRAGTTSYKEQYAIFYTSRATMVSQYDWIPEKQDEFERPPFQATFTVNNWTFTLYTIHTQPDSVSLELTNLENIIGVPTGDTIVIGDLNADGSYYDE